MWVCVEMEDWGPIEHDFSRENSDHPIYSISSVLVLRTQFSDKQAFHCFIFYDHRKWLPWGGFGTGTTDQ